MAKKSGSVSVEEKLRALYDVQLIDSKIDQIRATRGELPKEVQNLEDELAEIDSRMGKIKEEVENLNTEIGRKKLAIQEAEAQIKRYKAQEAEVKNSREFEALSKEMEFQSLEIELANKRINEYKAKIENKNELLEMATAKYAERKEDLDIKKGELDNILSSNEKYEKELLKLSDKFGENIEDRLLNGYKRIRNNAKNGLGVVPVIDGATQGSFFMVPPQRELDIRARKKIIISEHCGRILVDSDLAAEEEEKMNDVFAKA